MRERQILCSIQNMTSLLKLWFFLWLWSINRTHGQLQWDAAKCDEDGQVVDVPILYGNPCIQCVCKNEVIKCTRKTCPKLDDCALIFTTLGKSCCEKCQICRYNGEEYTSGERWRAPNDPCQHFECREGVVTASLATCAVACDNPIIVQDECCPLCPEKINTGLTPDLGCLYEGKQFSKGEAVTSIDDACLECTCKKDGLSCERRICPILSCPINQRKTLTGKCCPECVAPRKVFDLGHRCLFGSAVFDDGQSVLAELCTKCMCLDSTVICQRITCSFAEHLDCPEEDIIHEENECCPKCKPKTCSYGADDYEEGEMWKPHACESCQCVGGETTCLTQSCPKDVICAKNHILKRADGECCRTCVEKNALCSVFGDPHYRTFDGRLYNFQGTCKYILVSDCEDRTFTVRVRNDGKKTNNYAWTKTLFINLLGHQVTLLQDYAVRVDRAEVSLPHAIPEVLNVESDGYLVRLTTKIGLEVTWDGDSLVEVSIPPSYRNKLCGLCGDYNGDRLDDFRQRGGALAADPEIFAESWVSGKNGRCSRPTISSVGNRCDGNAKRKQRAQRECKILKSKAFRQCMKFIDVMVYYRSCVTDMCECPKHKRCSCEALTAFVTACQLEGIEVELDETNSCSEQTCPEGAVFDACGPPCSRTCSNRETSSECRRPCVAGCQCPAGFVMHRNRCILSSECP